MKQIEAGELPLAKVFSSDYDFAIPTYQRPYSWGAEQVLQLLDDLEGALERGDDEPYFLGSIVLVKQPGKVASDVIDGQQRLTTLTLLLAVLRDLAEGTDIAADLVGFIEEKGNTLTGTPAKPRLKLRERDAEFFAAHVQTVGATTGLVDLPDAKVATDAQARLRANAASIHERLRGRTPDERQALAALLVARTFLVVVATPEPASAHRIFSVMNARGLDLTPADIFKSRVIGDIDPTAEPAYAEKWELAEQDLGRADFGDLFLHVRTIVAKTRAQRELLKEFPEQVLATYLPDRAAEFVDEVLLPYAQAYAWIQNQDFTAPAGAERVNAWLSRLVQLDNNDWRPPALWALRAHASDPAYLDAFFARLERLAASMLLRRVYATPRALRYVELLKQLDRGLGLDAPAFDLSADERQSTRDRLAADIYTVAAVRKYLLLRLDETLANNPGVAYDHKIITVEHVLPQSPKVGSRWLVDFTDDDRTYWTHKLANLVLLNRTKNSAAQNYDFDTKKSAYFAGKNGVAVFALTTGVLQEQQWTPRTLEVRQTAHLEVLHRLWSLEG